MTPGEEINSLKEVAFIRIPRTGTTSVKAVHHLCGFSVFGGLDLAMWSSPSTPSRYGLKKPLHPSLAQSVKKFYEGLNRDLKFTFCFVRNPYDRAVSIWRHISFRKFNSFEKFCEKLEESQKTPHLLSQAQRWHGAPFSDHILDSSGDVLVDAVGRYENFQQDFKKICSDLDLRTAQLPIRNKSTKRSQNYASHYNKKTKEIISKIYERDIEFFGYKFGE